MTRILRHAAKAAGGYCLGIGQTSALMFCSRLPPAFIFFCGAARGDATSVVTLPSDNRRTGSYDPATGRVPTSVTNAVAGADDNARSMIWLSASVNCSGFHAPLGLNHF